MQDSIARAVALIEAQQEKMQAESNAWWLGEQLKEMITADAWAAGVVAEDLEQSRGKSLAAAERKIAEYASQHRQGNAGCCPPPVAERILREFFGIQRPEASGGQPAAGQTVAAPEEKLIALEDFF